MNSSIKPVHWPARRIPVAVRDELVQEIERMEHAGVIERIEQPTDWISPLVIVKMPNGRLRISMDPKHLN